MSSVETVAIASVPNWVKVGRYEIKTIRSEFVTCSDTNLSPRECQAISLFSIGKSGPQVAEAMNVSLHTIDTFKRRIFEKFGVKTIAEAVAIATAIATGSAIKKAVM